MTRPFKTSHEPDDVDSSEDAGHHTLGTGRHQAMPGDVLSSFTIKGARGSATFYSSITAALVALGATDATT